MKCEKLRERNGEKRKVHNFGRLITLIMFTSPFHHEEGKEGGRDEGRHNN